MHHISPSITAPNGSDLDLPHYALSGSAAITFLRIHQIRRALGSVEVPKSKTSQCGNTLGKKPLRRGVDLILQPGSLIQFACSPADPVWAPQRQLSSHSGNICRPIVPCDAWQNSGKHYALPLDLQNTVPLEVQVMQLLRLFLCLPFMLPSQLFTISDSNPWPSLPKSHTTPPLLPLPTYPLVCLL